MENTCHTFGVNLDTHAIEDLPLPNELCSNQVICSKPFVGMEFDSLDEAYLFYNEYARDVGFSVRKAKIRKSNVDGSLLFRRFCCSKEGHHRKDCGSDKYKPKQVTDGAVVKMRVRNHPVRRVGCDAKLDLKRMTDGRWVVQKFFEEHNHECARQGETHLLRSQRRIQSIQEQQNDTTVDGGMGVKEVVSYLTDVSGGSEKVEFIEQDLTNQACDGRKNIGKIDAEVVLNYFRQMQTEDPSFFYDIQVNEENLMLNCFWSDARSRMDFGYFGDVILFDTTYGTNKYGRPIAPFFGVNHHLQTVLFGCAILLNENEDSMAWLLETLLRAMSGNHPVVIITNQDPAMAKAIERVLPRTHHRLCLWNIFLDAAKHLSHLFNTKNDFVSDLKKCIYEPQWCDEFESMWASMLEKYELRDNEWLNNMYMKRQNWVSVYSRHIFHADMATSQRSESINSFFNGYLNCSLPLSEFLKQYEKALDCKREKETSEDFKSKQTRPVLKLDLPMEQQAADVYTRSVFKEFHKEFCDSFNYIAEESERVGTNWTYMVSRWGQNRKYSVNFNSCNSDIQVTCSCQNFEFTGILCRHIFKVFTVTNVTLVPEVYIKKRWTKKAKCPVDLDSEMQADCQKSLALRYTNLCHLSLKLSAKGAISINAYQIAKRSIERALIELENVVKEDKNITQSDIVGTRSSNFPVEYVKNTGSSKTSCE